MPTQTVAKFLSAKNSELSTLIERAQHLQQLSAVLEDALHHSQQSELAKHVTFANLRGDTAVLATDSPAWLTHLRYQAPTILKLLKQQPGLQALRKIQFKILPSSQKPISQPARRAALSISSANLLKSAANHTPDSNLSDALRRLSLHKTTPKPTDPQ